MLGDKQTQIKQYKDFTTITNIRKLTQQAINPIVKSIEGKMNNLLSDNQQLRKHLTKIQQIYKQHENINKTIQNNFQIFLDYKDSQSYIRQKESNSHQKLLNNFDKNNADIESIRNSIQYQNQNIDVMKKKNQKISALYSTLQTRNDIALKQLQQKHTNFSKEMLNQCKDIKGFYQQSSIQIQSITQAISRDKDDIFDKLKTVQLFEKQRNSFNQKFQDIYNKIIMKINKEEFQGFRKSQNSFMNQKMDEIETNLNELLPPNLRRMLPIFEEKLKQVDKIQRIQQQIRGIRNKLTQISENEKQKTKDTNTAMNNVAEQFNKQIEKLKGNLKKQIKMLNNQIKNTEQMISEKMVEVKKTIQVEVEEKMSERFEQQASQIHKTIQHQVAIKNETISHERDNEIQKYLQQIKYIQKEMLAKSQTITTLADSVIHTLQNYSSKITKIKSDYQIFANSMRKQVHAAVKMKEVFNQNLADIGRVLSGMTEFLLMSGALHYQSINEIYRNNNNMNEVYVSHNDGIIYQFKTENKASRIFYRRHKLDSRHFVKSYMFTMVNYFDEVFGKYGFLRWKEQKPSQVFYSRCFDNYQLRLMKCSESIKIVKSSNNLNKGKNNMENDEFLDLNINNYTPNKGNTMQATHNMKKSYSIKKPRTSLDKSRYEQQYMSARSACKTKMSQLN